MKLARRRLVRLAAGAAALPVMLRIAKTQTYPIRPITMIVPFAAGGTTDVLARVLAERMRRVLGQPLIIENVSGADGSIGTGRAARANPDGHTIELGFLGTHVLNGAFYSLPYDVLHDFAPISPLVMFPEILLAKKTMPARDLRELIAWLKANPRQASVRNSNRWDPAGHGVLSEADRDEIKFRPVSGHRARRAGFSRRPD